MVSYEILICLSIVVIWEAYFLNRMVFVIGQVTSFERCNQIVYGMIFKCAFLRVSFSKQSEWKWEWVL